MPHDPRPLSNQDHNRNVLGRGLRAFESAVVDAMGKGGNRVVSVRVPINGHKIGKIKIGGEQEIE